MSATKLEHSKQPLAVTYNKFLVKTLQFPFYHDIVMAAINVQSDSDCIKYHTLKFQN